MRKLFVYLYIKLGISCFFISYLPAQNDSLPFRDISQAPVQDILDLPVSNLQGNEIVSASKKAEDIFDAPVAASVITRAEIEQAGCLSIMEALRLLPGVLVRETSNGNYDINIRGFNNVPPGSNFYSMDNSNSLVMIDYRPIYNYFSGGTFWEALPIDIQDIERIELVRGPVAALYGTNAVTGVIHIITRQPTREGLYLNGQAEYGNQNTLRLNTAAGYAVGTQFHGIISANMTRRDRFSTEFYDLLEQNYTTAPDTIASFQTGNVYELEGFQDAFPDENLAIDRYGFNTFLAYRPKVDLGFELSAGFENSQAIRPFAENTYTPHSTMLSESWYVNLRNQIRDGSFQVAYLAGKQEPGKEALGSKFDFEVLDLMADYNFAFQNFSLKPGLSYRRTVYDDTDYFNTVDSTLQSGLLNGRKAINSLAASLRFDYTWQKFRFIAAGRVDKFNIPDRYYPAWQFAINYKINKRHLLRAVYARSYRGATFTEVYADFRDSFRQLAPGVFTATRAIGNAELDLMRSGSVEIGYRYQPNEKLFVDVEGFWSTGKDFNKIILDQPVDTILVQGSPAVVISPTFEQTNVDLEAEQQGITLALSYQPLANLRFRGFLTWQRTQLSNVSPYDVTPQVDPVFNLFNQTDVDDYTGTPRFYGGFYVNYRFKSVFNINLNGYYFGEHEITHASDAFLGRPATVAEIVSKLLVNLKLTYQPIQALSIYANIRNLSNADPYEYYFTDPTQRSILGGFQYTF